MNCGQEGHKSPNCPHPKKEKSQTNPTSDSRRGGDQHKGRGGRGGGRGNHQNNNNNSRNSTPYPSSASPATNIVHGCSVSVLVLSETDPEFHHTQSYTQQSPISS